MNLPRVIIVSTEKGKANEIATNIGAEKLPDQDYFEYYVWNIQNKYYKAQVLLCVTETPSPNISIDDVEALIVHHNPQAENSDDSLKEWSHLIASLAEAEVLLFSCNFIANGVLREKVIKWCLQNKFELVEFNRPDVDDSEADSEHNKYGIERIIEALHAHMWPNMILKGKPSSINGRDNDMNEVEEQFENIELNQEPRETLPMESLLDGIMGDENADFGELLSHLRAMKEYAASLPPNQRQKAVVEVVAAFWRAMGGDPSEIGD